MTTLAAPDAPPASTGINDDDEDDGGITTTPAAIGTSATTTPDVDDDDDERNKNHPGDADHRLVHVVELVLSRGAYRCGDTVCGTVRLFLRRDGDDGGGDGDYGGDGGDGGPSSPPTEGSAAAAAAADETGGDRLERAALERMRRLRGRFRAATVHVAGRCRLDPRWHPAIAGGGVVDSSSEAGGARGGAVESKSKLSIGEMYGSVHPLLAGLPDETRRVIDGGGDAAVVDAAGGGGGATVCFFATDCVDLLGLPEREEPRELEPFRPSSLSPSRSRRRRRGGGGGGGGGDEGDAAAAAAAPPAGAPPGGDGAAEDDVRGAGGPASTTADGGTAAVPQPPPDPGAGRGVGGPPPESSTAAAGEPGRRMRGRPRREHLAFTFRAPLPPDLPHTVRATCCGYYYSAVASVRTDSGEVITAQVPFTVLSCSRMTLEGGGGGGPANAPALRRHPSSDVGNKAGARSGGRVRFGPCVATAHSRGLPCRVSATTLNRRAQVGVSSTGLCSTMTARDSRSVRVTNADGVPFCVLTLVGTDVVLPGGRVLLQFQFTRELLRAGQEHRRDEMHDGIGSVANGSSSPPPPLPLRCLQVCTCLRGEEVACFGAARATTRTYVFDARHALVEDDTMSLAMSLLLPMDCPCSLSTDLVDVSIFCQIELTVEKAGGGHETLRLDLPCRVVHTKIYRDNDDSTNDAEGHNSANYLGHVDEMGSEEGGGLTQDVLNDLTMLSLRMIEDCY